MSSAPRIRGSCWRTSPSPRRRSKESGTSGVNRSAASGTPNSTTSTIDTAAASDQRTQLHVRNLPYSVRWQDVKDLFRRAGTVLRVDVHLTADNRSCGTGTVLLATEDDALRAVTRHLVQEFTRDL